MYCAADELPFFQLSTSSPVIFHPSPLLLSFFFFCSGLSSCLPSIFLSSLSSGDGDYLGASRHSISPGGKVTHSALQLALGSCRFKFEVPSILTATLLDSELLPGTPPKAVSAQTVTPPNVLRSRRSNGCVCVDKRADPYASELFLSQFMKYLCTACQRFYRKTNSVCAPVLPVMSKNVSLCETIYSQRARLPFGKQNDG